MALISVELTELYTEALDRIAKRNKQSRAEAARSALSEFIERHERPAFGLLKERPIDSLKFQRKIRAEWKDR